MDDVQEPEMKSKEQELQELETLARSFEKLQSDRGWLALRATFLPAIKQMQAIVLGSATRTVAGGDGIDGLQAVQIEAFEKGQIKGMSAVLDFPLKWLEQVKDDIEMLKRTIALREDENEERNDGEEG